MLGKLVGGPYDGVEEPLFYDEAPPEVRAWKCPRCSDIHIAAPDETPPGIGLRYRLERVTTLGTAVYVYGELKFLGTENREKELVGA